MFYDALQKIKQEYKSRFDFSVICKIDKICVDEGCSNIKVNKDFIIIKLIDKERRRCPLIIYLGINDSTNYYGLYLNNKAIVYNYEKFNSFSEFEKEILHFLSNPIRSEETTTSNGIKIYTDFFINDYENKSELSFREYYQKKSFWRFFGMRKTMKIKRNFLAWK